MWLWEPFVSKPWQKYIVAQLTEYFINSPKTQGCSSEVEEKQTQQEQKNNNNNSCNPDTQAVETGRRLINSKSSWLQKETKESLGYISI